MTSNKISLKFDIQDIKNYGYNPEVKLKLKTKKLEQLGWQPKVSLDDILLGLVQSMRFSKESTYE